jgi:murein DD-endopeptidase MepM/ murein hydrolase activator NlpD
VQGDLQALLAAAAARAAAAQRAQEAALAAAAAAARKGAGGTPPPVTINPTPGSYANPLRGVRALNAERIDQGVDYNGFGPITAVGDGVVMNTANAGWPGGTFICYKLTDGPANGLAVYAAEDISPAVNVGQKVTVNTVLGTVYEGPSGIETGWADPNCGGDAMASGVYQEGRSTAYGLNFSQMLASLGAPPGVLQNNPPDGSLPPNWPSW